ncbi:phosphate regulon sensor histidine kinase PhoR [Nitratireductor basaltis]|nr:phosphate regulon sensor histidine kinase PhoR [Nitratireductor basaltis]
MKNVEVKKTALGDAAPGVRLPVAAALALMTLLGVDLFHGGNGLVAVGAAGAFLVGLWLANVEAKREVKAELEEKPKRAIDRLTAAQLGAAVNEPLYIINGKREVAFVNAVAEEAFGTVAIGASLQLKFRAPEIQELLDQLVSTNQPQMLDYVERVPVERAYRVHAAPIGEGTGLYILLFRDQSETRRIEKMRSDFIANASHELRTPLASVSGFIETLRGPAREDDRARDHFLSIMHEQTSRMARLIDDLLSLSRLEMKPFSKPSEQVELNRLVSGVADSLGHIAADNGIEIKLDMPEDPLRISGNRDELVQVFQNLIENACKYGSGGGKVVVRGLPASDGNGCSISVRDFGPGIPQEHIPRLTERFYRVDVETSRAQKGTGLGLAIVKHILSRHGARLTIRSKLGEGSTFAVHFPGPSVVATQVEQFH